MTNKLYLAKTLRVNCRDLNHLARIVHDVEILPNFYNNLSRNNLVIISTRLCLGYGVAAISSKCDPLDI